MRLYEILTEAPNPQMGLKQTSSAMRDLDIMLTDVSNNLDTAIQDGDYGQILPATSKIGKWFKGNYQGRLQDSLMGLRNQKAFSFLQDGLKQIVLTMNKDKMKDAKTGGPEKFRTSFKQLEYLMDLVMQTYQKAQQTPYRDAATPQDIKQLQRTQERFASVKDKIKQLSNAAKADKKAKDDPNSAADKEKENKTKQMGGQQRDQATQVANQVIATLPKEHQHEIRQIVAKSDNKLQALQQAMKQRGLTEGIKRLKRILAG